MSSVSSSGILLRLTAAAPGKRSWTWKNGGPMLLDGLQQQSVKRPLSLRTRSRAGKSGAPRLLLQIAARRRTRLALRLRLRLPWPSSCPSPPPSRPARSASPSPWPRSASPSSSPRTPPPHRPRRHQVRRLSLAVGAHTPPPQPAGNLESVGSTYSTTSRMESFFSTHSDVPEGFVGESQLDAAQGVGGASESAMSASAAPRLGRRKVAATRPKQTNFSAFEDNVLCKSWLEISNDAATNTGQRKEAFWMRVLNRYNSQCGNYPERSQKSVMSRWDYIKAEVSKFSGHMAEMLRSNPSGMSDADKSVAAAANFAGIEKHNFTLMHCWKILKDEPKWCELKRRMDASQGSSSKENVPTSDQRNILVLDLNDPSPDTSTTKRPMGRDATKAAKKKVAAASGSHEYVSRMRDISDRKIEILKEAEAERKTRLTEIITLEKVKAEEAREHRLVMLELERERLAMEKQRLQMEAKQKEKEDEEREKKEDERILAINLDQCQPLERIYYQALQQDIINNMRSRRRQ